MSKIKYFSEDEIKRFFEPVRKEKNVRDLLFFKLMYHYGLRLAETLTIRMEDITPTQIHIRRLKGGISRFYDWRIDDRKLLERWLRRRQKIENSAHNPFLFITSRSSIGPMSEAMGKKLHRKYCDLAGVNSDKRNNVHAWRHSCAITLLMQGYDVFFVKTWLGHKSISSTMVYLEIMPPQWAQLSKGAIENAFSD